ncbi:MAG: zinc ribbon domain-containing protein [Cenarchaeum sp. SB0663_bin_5]|nr:zinc ribbon domain-containing protein [Cenarchaeum sp. SB0663_bin_5]MYH04336.1 zinc ribbon domain-containing protein [Cenarchaeum sp. SB0675_bin_21]MYL10734.1 zinc ribbon domain-containing protein [Cenarchaeum sp. SB0669_bin_11]
MVWPIVLAVVLGALGVYALSQDRPKCPNCGTIVAKKAHRCGRCGAPLGWE